MIPSPVNKETSAARNPVLEDSRYVMAYGNLIGTGFFEITDPENFVVFADYELPKVLRKENILVYSETLAKKVDAGEVLDAGSE